MFQATTRMRAVVIRRAPLVPGRRLLVRPRRAQHRRLVVPPSRELKTDRQPGGGEAHGSDMAGVADRLNGVVYERRVKNRHPASALL
jgi:hypothetical protein